MTMQTRKVSRRDIMQMAGVGAAAIALGSCASSQKSTGPAATKGRINHSVAHWCFAEHWDLDEICRVAKKLGIKSVELVGPDAFPTLKKYGLVCAISPNGTPDPPFVKGLNNPKYHDMIIAKTKETIDACAGYKFPNVIAFTGFREDIPDDVGAKNCVAGLKKLMGHAEKKKVNVCMEILNSRVDVEMKGHPGYQGDHTDYCMDIIKKVGSPRMKILFDIYHVQVMDGDIISRIKQHAEYIGHVHTAGNPGRNEIDDTQEINYRAVMKTLVDTGYKGYVGHEFIPTRNPLKSLREAVEICDV
ncbi:MAG TPA: TIM barrel protein [Sedimentisphaerales bacterium]|nr:TIM barrel protein [Sedimentisphaerales bacterium]